MTKCIQYHLLTLGQTAVNCSQIREQLLSWYTTSLTLISAHKLGFDHLNMQKEGLPKFAYRSIIPPLICFTKHQVINVLVFISAVRVEVDHIRHQPHQSNNSMAVLSIVIFLQFHSYLFSPIGSLTINSSFTFGRCSTNKESKSMIL